MRSASELYARGYLGALKELLKERRVTYAQLADSLHCSLPTVKRALNKPSLPLNRLLEFCEIAKIPFRELTRRAEQGRPTHYVFDAAQDRLFAERPEFLAYYLELAKEGAQPADIAKQHDLDQRSTDIYLSRLARLGLVERHGKNRARLLIVPPVGFGPGSLVLRKRHTEFLREIVSRVLDAEPGVKGSFAVLKQLQLSDEDYNQLVADMENVIHRYAAVAERGLSKGATSRWQVALASGPSPEGPRERLPRVDR